jgi:SAM-dependent methyltransferase
MRPADPRPPLRLARRVGELDPTEPWSDYDRIGLAMRERIDVSLPDGWVWTDRRALDFGCGVGRVLRHYADEAERAELWGCDIHAPSIAWMKRALSPPFHVFLVDESPRLPQTDGFFDLLWAVSVFTHLAETWSGWLRELHRVLADGGTLMVSILGPGMWDAIAEGPWDEDRTGMCVLRAGQPWAAGGPTVFHSEWWLRAHWGRVFEIITFDPGRQPGSHGWVVLRKVPGAVSDEELERASDDQREVEALRHNIELLNTEDRWLRPRYLRLTASSQRKAARWWIRRLRARI